MKRLTLLGSLLAAMAVFAGGYLTGCESDKGTPPVNILPGIELTATPPAGDTTRYDVEFHWTGWDEDGEVEYFEYYIDPPIEFIQNPSGFPFADTMTWVPTEAYSGRFTFFAPAYDSSTIDEPDLDFRDPQIGLGYHLFAIRAVDDLGGRSVVNDSSWVAFTAATICPRSRISSPPPGAAEGTYVGVGQPVGTRVTIRWDGSDSDGIFNDKPLYYKYKLTHLRLGPVTPTWNAIDDSILADPGPWIDLDEGVLQTVVGLDNLYSYGLAVRAVDEAGAVEPLLVLNRNMLWMSASEQSAFPDLYVRSSAFGNRDWRGWYIDVEEYEVPLGSLYEFSIVGNADLYGGLITGYSYGWNLSDVETTEIDPSGIGAWTPWSTTNRTIVANFSEEFTNKEDVFLYIRCKDDGGAVTLGTIRFKVVTLNPDKKLAYIDDWRLYPQTGQRGEVTDDINWQLFMRGYDYGRGWDELVWDEWEAPVGEEMPSLAFLSQFENLVWSLNDRRELGADQKSAFFNMSYTNTMNVLAVYLGSEAEGGVKGKCWLFGNGMVESCVMPYGGNGCGYPYPVNDDAPVLSCTIRPRSFAYDFLHITGQFDRNMDEPSGSRVQFAKNSSDGAAYFAFDETGPAIADTLYKFDPVENPAPYQNMPRRLHIDLSKFRALTMQTNETLEHPSPDAPEQFIFFNPWLQRHTNLVPLYRFRAKAASSKADNRYCGFRFIPAGRNDHGEIVYFLFNMYPLENEESRQLAKAVLTDMFGLPDPD